MSSHWLSQGLEPMLLLFFFFLTKIEWLPPGYNEYFLSCLAALSFDSVILPLIVSAGQLTKMAGLPCGSLLTMLQPTKGGDGEEKARRNKILHPPLSQRSARSLFHSFLPALSVSVPTKWLESTRQSFFVDVRWRVIMRSLSWLKEQVEAQTGFHWGPLKHTHTKTRTHSQCGKRMLRKEGQLFGWLVKMAIRFRGRWPTVNSTCAYGLARGCGGKQSLSFHPVCWEVCVFVISL